MSNCGVRIKECYPQKVLRNIKGRSVIVDVLCIDFDGNYYNIEIQKADNDDHQRRVRYNASNVDTYISRKSTDFKELPDIYIIYISNFDIFGGRKPIYIIDRVIRGTNKVVDNGFHEIYVNTVIKDNSAVSDLMDDFTNKSIPKYDSRFPNVNKVVRYYKEGEGRDKMCAVVEELSNKKVKDIAIKMIKKGFTNDSIIELTSLTDEEINELRSLNQAE